jgi:hypothetical protein
MDTREKLIPLNIAARKYGLPRKWLLVEARAKRLPCLIAGGAILFDESLLTAELLKRAQRTGGGQESKATILCGGQND